MKPVVADEAVASTDKTEVVKSEAVPKEPAITESEKTVDEPAVEAVEESIFEPLELPDDGADEQSDGPDEAEVSVPEADSQGFKADESIKSEADSFEPEDEPDVEEAETVEAFSAGALEVDDFSNVAPVTSSYYMERPADADDFSVTVISEKNSSVKNGLLLGAFSFIVFGFFSVMIFSLFNNLDDIPALNPDPNLIAYLDDTPMPVEDLKDERESDNKSGGGGGGGKEEPQPASEGVRPPMMKQPVIAPSSKMTRMTDPDLKIQAGIQGPIDEKKRIPGRYGIPGSLNQDASDGRGSGGGIGSGTGRGVGSGNGTGFGSGDGSGMGSGSGDGIGDGSGSGNRRRRSPPRATGPSTPFRILSKPRPGYTESARKNNVTGMVRLRVTFNSNGTIGSITPISGLGHGLTEQAIAAARGIRFAPEVRNGRPLTVKKTVIFNFTIY